MSTIAGSTRLAICALVSTFFEVDVADDAAGDPCDSPRATPAPAPAATMAVAVRPSNVRPWCRRGGSGYCPYGRYWPCGYCANGSLIGPVTPNPVRSPCALLRLAALLLATQEESVANLGGPRRDHEPDLLVT